MLGRCDTCVVLQGVLNRYVTMRQNEGKKATERRPYIATECDNLFEAEKWRQQVLKEVGRKISEIQNSTPSAPELLSRTANSRACAWQCRWVSIGYEI